MKQLYKQPSGVGPIPTSARHQTAPSSTRSASSSSSSSFPRSQRLLFLVIGAFIASSFFLLRPLDSPRPSSFHRRTSAAAGAAVSSGGLRLPTRPPPRRLPVGVRRPGLRVVVTGGAGFVGSHLVDRLVERGDSVIVIDNFFTGRKQNVAHHLGNPRFELIRHDVVEPILLEVDQIYHLACPASPVHYKFNPIKTIISFSGDIYS